MSVGKPDSGLFTGLYWEQSRALATFLSHTGPPRIEPVAKMPVRWRVQGPRRCIGVYDPSKGARCPCPSSREPESGSQCRACALVDPGRLVAQDRVGPDGTLPAGAFRAYLALFGRDTVKIGLTAQRRAADRLLEQGAFAHVFLCEGAYPAIRQVERLVSSRLGLPERLTWRGKRGLWHEATDPGRRAAVLAAVADQAREFLAERPVVILIDETVVDDLPEYGVAPDALPTTLRVATRVHSGDVLAGAVRGVVGKMLILDTGEGPLVVDTRVLEGWCLPPCGPDAQPHLSTPPTEESTRMEPDQATLFSM